jgi:hypothetical protein
MSSIGTASRRLFGLSSDSGARAAGDGINQMVGETLPVGTTARMFQGPIGGGSGAWSAHVRVTSAAGAASAMTFGYSNLPNPDVTDDTHWEDSGITPVDLTATATKVVRPAGVTYVGWVRVKAVVAVSTGKVVVYTRADGSDV